MTADTLTPADLDGRAESIALTVAEATGQPLKDEMYPAEVVAFVRGAGYELDRELLGRLVELKRVPGPVRHVYAPVHVGHLIAYLDRLRCWQPGSHFHEVKRTRFEAEASARKAAGLPAVDGLDVYPVRWFVLMLSKEADPVIRSGLAVGLLSKLDALGVDCHA